MKLQLIIFLAFVVVLFFSACNYEGEKEKHADGNHDGQHEGAVKPTSSTGNFGAPITIDDAVAATELPVLLAGKEVVEVKLTGNVKAVCQMTGCWMDVSIGEGETVHVTFKDDEFLMPKDATGKTAVIEGWATYEEIPVDMLKHLAKDEGKSEEEIATITKPKMEYTFVARGVILEDNLY